MEASSPLPEPPNKITVQRLKYTWRFFLISNLALGAYMFAIARKRDVNDEKEKALAEKVQSNPVSGKLVYGEPVATPIVELMKERTPLHDEEKRKLFDWILGEKRKIIPKDHLEKKCIDEDKAILKQFIRGKSIPDI